MKVAVVAVTEGGRDIALRLRELRGWDVYLPQRFQEEGVSAIEGDFPSCVARLFATYEGIIFVTALGIAVRTIAPLLRGKDRDPAVVVVDERGRFSVSVCAAHLGGANDLTREVAELLGAQAVVTTASDGAGLETPDVKARRFGLRVENLSTLKVINRLMLEGERVVYLLGEDVPEEVGEKLAPREIVFPLSTPPSCAGAVVVTDHAFPLLAVPFVVLRPRQMVVGVGLKRNVPRGTIEAVIGEALERCSLARGSIRCLATIEYKKGEEGLRELASSWEVPLSFYSLEEVASVAHHFPSSPWVAKTLGVGSVARPCAFLASSGGEEEGYLARQGVTVAIFRRKSCGLA